MGSWAAPPRCAHLLSAFKDKVLLCQQRKVTCGDSVHSWMLPVIKGIPEGSWGPAELVP